MVLPRTSRLLVLWLCIALQAMVPFIHAHAGVAHLTHVGFLHQHAGGVAAAPGGHTLESDAHGVEVVVATGLPARKTTPGLAADMPPAPSPLSPLPAGEVQARDASLPRPPASHRPSPGYTLPPALAPPAA